MKNGRRALVQDGIKPGQGRLYGYTIGVPRTPMFDRRIIPRMRTVCRMGGEFLSIGRNLRPSDSTYLRNS